MQGPYSDCTALRAGYNSAQDINTLSGKRR